MNFKPVRFFTGQILMSDYVMLSVFNGVVIFESEIML